MDINKSLSISIRARAVPYLLHPELHNFRLHNLGPIESRSAR